MKNEKKKETVERLIWYNLVEYNIYTEDCVVTFKRILNEYLFG